MKHWNVGDLVDALEKLPREAYLSFGDYPFERPRLLYVAAHGSSSDTCVIGLNFEPFDSGGGIAKIRTVEWEGVTTATTPPEPALYCSACAAPIANSYAKGRCFVDEADFTPSNEHDEAQSFEETFGKPDDHGAILAQLEAWTDRGLRRRFSVVRASGRDESLGLVLHRWDVRLEDEELSWSAEEDGVTLLPDAVRLVLAQAAKDGLP